MTKEQIEQLALHHFPVRHKHNKKGTGEYDPNYPRRKAYILGASETLQGLWKDAQGDDLPDIDREVIVLLDNGKVVFAHRPPEFWDGKNIVTGKVTRNYPKTYDKGGWNIPNVAFWLDLDIPKL